MNSGVQCVELYSLVQVSQALEEVVQRCLAPRGGHVLFTKDTGEVLICRDGRRILTALRLEHPLARVLVECVSAHCANTGDGAKSFILYLAAILRGIQANRGGLRPHHNVSTRGVTQQLLSFPAQVLDCVMREHIAPHATSLFNPGDPQSVRRGLRLLTEAFFLGRTGPAHAGFLAELTCEFYFNWQCEEGRVDRLRLLGEHFTELHTPISGLPVVRSRVLQGVVLHRDFAVRCPMPGPVRVVVVTVSLQPQLTDAASTLVLTSNSQLQSCASWISQQVEESMASLQGLQVSLLLSAVKQPEQVLYEAVRAGVSVVECLDEDELAFFCHVTGAAPLADRQAVKLENVAVATFCRPLVLGSRRYVHLGFPSGQYLQPHSLVLCGPIPGLVDQYVSSFRDAIKMLQRVSEPIQCLQNNSVRPNKAQLSGLNTTIPSTSVEPGAVLPAGGAFELLLHHYLLQRSSSSTCADTKATLRLVAEALLSVPCQIYSHRAGKRRFLKLHTEFICGVQERQPVGPVKEGQVGLESLAGKYQLLASVLQCVGRLLAVDAIVRVRKLVLEKEEADDED